MTPSPKEFADEVRRRQKNLVWPDFVVNGGLVDGFLVRGSAGAPLVQRIGAWLFGLTFLGQAAVLLSIALDQRLWFVALFSVAWMLLGLTVCRSALRGRKARHDRESD